MNFTKQRIMRKIISIGFFLLIWIGLLGINKACAQEVTLPREVAEFYLEQKKENDARKEIIEQQDTLIAVYAEKIGFQELLLYEKDLEISSWETINKLTSNMVVVLQEEVKEERGKLFWWKVKTVVITAVCIIIILI